MPGAGYQKGRCFYCFSEISVGNVSSSAEVDHFFPHTLKQVRVLFPVDGIWNLVLSCRDCNRVLVGNQHEYRHSGFSNVFTNEMNF